MSPTNRTRGTTLIELMVAMGILSVMMLGLMSLMVTFNVNTNQTTTTADLQDSARTSLDLLAADIRAAGIGASNGTVGIAPQGKWSARIPSIYSGPLQNFRDPSGATYQVRSIFIVGAEPATTGLNIAGDGVMAVITAPGNAKIRCSVVAANGAASDQDCTTSVVGVTDLLEHGIVLPGLNGALFAPLLVHDHQRASFITPTAVSGTMPNQQVSFAENTTSTSVSISPDPSAPFGFAQGFQVSRARVVHWYLYQPDVTKPPRLMRSRPVLTSSATGCPNLSPFNDADVGNDLGGGGVESLQFRFVFDTSQEDDPTKYDAVDNIDPCIADPVTRMRQLREVRIQLVAISATPAKDTTGKAIAPRFSNPGFEGVTIGAGVDSYPRRAYVTRVAPRNVQPYRM